MIDLSDATDPALVDAVFTAYQRARREVYDYGLRDDDPALTPRQREVLTALTRAEAALDEHQREQRAWSQTHHVVDLRGVTAAPDGEVTIIDLDARSEDTADPHEIGQD